MPRRSEVPIAVLASLLAVPAFGQVTVPTQHNDNARSGANTGEIVLTQANVSGGNFGKLFTRSLDADVNGQVLYVPNLTIGGGVHNVIIAYTSNNSNGSPCSLYAFDADQPGQTNALWRHQFTNSAEWTTCTPAIDTSTNTIYVVTKDTNDSGATHLHAIDLLTGNEKTGSPVTVAATVAGTGDGSVGGKVSFDTGQANCRPGLLFADNSIYIAFAHNSDSFPYHGWIFRYTYNGSAFAQANVFCTSPNGGLDGIWMAGNGLAADADGNIYTTTGNGTFDINTGGSGYGMSVLKLSSTLGPLDYFTPFDEAGNSNSDLDFGSCGVLMIPGTTKLFTGGTKFGSAFLLDSTGLGHFSSGGPDAALDRVDNVSSNDDVGQNPVGWDSGTYKYAYLWPGGSNIEQFRYDPGTGKLNPGTIFKQNSNFTDGGSLAVSSQGTANGILWTVGNNAVVRALNATDVTLPVLWDSSTNQSRDGLGSVGHFQFPTVANGRVYVPTDSGSIVVYGLLTTTSTPRISPASGSFSGSEQVTLTDSGATMYYTSDGTMPYPGQGTTQAYTAPFNVTATTTVNAIAFSATSEPSAVASQTYTLTSSNGPPTPTGLTATGGDSSVSLAWTASTGAASYNVYMGTTAGGESATPLATGITSTTYNATGLTNGQTYYFTVAAVSAAGTSGMSNEASAIALPSISYSAGVQFISSPVDFTTPLDTLFGMTNTTLFAWDPAQFTYVQTPTQPSDDLHLGVGYWVNLPTSVTLNGTGSPASTTRNYSITLSPGWNSIGDPFFVSVPVTSLLVNGTPFDQASSGAGELVFSQIYGYNGAHYTAATSIAPESGYWIYAFQTCTLEVPHP